MPNLLGCVLRPLRHHGKPIAGVLTVLWAAGVFLVSTWQQPGLPSWGLSSLWAPAAHALMYLVLASLLVWLVVAPGRRQSRVPLRRRRLVLSLAAVFLAATLYGASLELYQGAIGRDPSWQDGVFNALGAGMGTVIAYIGVVARPARVGPWGRD